MAFIGKIPAAAALTSSDVADGIITNAKLAQDIISADTALGAEPADTDEFLVSDAGTLKRMDYSHIKGGGRSTLIKTITASSDSTISLVDGTSDVVFDNTYKKYVIDFFDIKSATDNVDFEFNGSIDAGSNYNVTKTTTVIEAYNGESGSGAVLQTSASGALEQATGFQRVAPNLGNGADESAVGEIVIWNPSDTTNVKHWQQFCTYYQKDNVVIHYIVSGYFNTTDDIDAVQLKMSSGNVASGVIKLYGVT